jgi:hypothetical protein
MEAKGRALGEIATRQKCGRREAPEEQAAVASQSAVLQRDLLGGSGPRPPAHPPCTARKSAPRIINNDVPGSGVATAPSVTICK